jgi:hypothetical protein
MAPKAKGKQLQLISGKKTGDTDTRLAYKLYDRPIVQITELIQATLSGAFRVKGKTVWPIAGQDFNGQLKHGLDDRDLENMLKGTYVTGEIRGTFSPVCGDYYFIADLNYITAIDTFNGKVPEPVWNHIVTSVPCDKCGCRIKSNQACLTSVKARKQQNTYRVVCADCVTEALDEATSPKQQNSSNEVPPWKSVSKSIANESDKLIAQKCAYH